MRSTLFSVLAFGAAVAVAQTPNGVQKPKVPPVQGGPTSQGCFKSFGELKPIQPRLESPSTGSCNTECTKANATVSAIHAGDCYCGTTYPPKTDVVEDKHCDYPCQFYPQEACGGLDDDGYYSVFNTGIEVAVPYAGSKQATPSSSGPTASNPGQTVIVTQPPKEEAKPSSGSNTAGIAAGVVVGVVAIAGIVGAIIFYLRRKRNRELEEEHRRTAAVNSFIGGGKPPSSSSGLSMTDSRMDPSLAPRRMSSGSIADNQDYSRKILRVTNV